MERTEYLEIDSHAIQLIFDKMSNSILRGVFPMKGEEHLDVHMNK